MWSNYIGIHAHYSTLHFISANLPIDLYLSNLLTDKCMKTKDSTKYANNSLYCYIRQISKLVFFACYVQFLPRTFKKLISGKNYKAAKYLNPHANVTCRVDL